MWRRAWWLLVGLVLGIMAVSSYAFAQTPWGFGGSAQLLPWGTSAGNTTELRFYELVAGGGQYVYWKAPDSIPTTWGCTWPTAPGTVNQTLRTDGGNPCTLTWSTGAGLGSVTNTGVLTANAFILGNGGTDVLAQAINGIVIGHGASAPTAYVGTTPCAAGDFVTALNLFGVATCATPAGSGNVTAGATLTANRLILGADTTAVAVLGSLGTTTTLLHGNAAGAPTFGAVSLTADVSGLLPVANGGTGVGTLTIHGVLLGQTTGAVVATAAGATGTVLAGTGASDPSFTATPTVTSVTTTGQGAVVIGPSGVGAGNTGEVRWLELAAGGVNYRGFKAPDALTGDLIWTLPAADGANGECLATNGAGVLSWGVCSAGAGTGITSLNGLNAAVQTFANDTNVTMVSATATHTITWAGLLAVTRGGTGLASGTSGGIPYFSGATTLASSGVLTANRLVLGGGAGASPTALGAGTATTVLHGNAAGAPTFSAVALADLGTTGTPTVSTYLRGDYAWISAPFAPTNASYVVITNDATLTAERALAVSTGLSLSDGGANAAVTLLVNQATAFNWTGAQTWTQGAQFSAGVPILPTGGNMGPGTINVSGGYYINGVLQGATATGLQTSTFAGLPAASGAWGPVRLVTDALTGIYVDTHNGAVDQWVPLNQPVNVRLRGATCNDSTDDAPKIQAAINAAPSGATIYLPGCASAYLIASPLTNAAGTKSLTLVGDNGPSGTGTVLHFTGGTGVAITGTHGYVLRGLAFTGAGTAISINPGGASADGVIDTIRTEATVTTGVDFVSGNNEFKLTNSVLRASGVAVHIAGSNSDSVIGFNWIDSTGTASIHYDGTPGGLKVIGNKMFGTSAYGILVDATGIGQSDLIVSGNSIEDFTVAAIKFTGVNGLVNISLTGNQISGQASVADSGIWFAGAVDNVAVTGNNINMNPAIGGGAGIRMDAGVNINVTGNTIVNVDTGIMAAGGTTGVIAANRINYVNNHFGGTLTGFVFEVPGFSVDGTGTITKTNSLATVSSTVVVPCGTLTFTGGVLTSKGTC